MNARDFCFWMQGYVELTNGEQPSVAVWKLIIEHLELAVENEDYSADQFLGVVQMMSGFVSIAGVARPNKVQWKRITTVVKDAFEKVTSELVKIELEIDVIETGRDIKKEWEEIQKKLQPLTPDPSPYIPNPATPWVDPLPPLYDPNKIICSTGNTSKTFCGTNKSQKLCSSPDVACSNIELKEAWFAPAGYNRGEVDILEDMYDEGVDIADANLGNNPLGYK